MQTGEMENFIFHPVRNVQKICSRQQFILGSSTMNYGSTISFFLVLPSTEESADFMCQSTFVSLCLYRDFCCLEQPWLTSPLREEINIDCSSIMLCYWERYGMTSITQYCTCYHHHMQIGIFSSYPSSWLWDWSCSIYLVLTSQAFPGSMQFLIT